LRLLLRLCARHTRCLKILGVLKGVERNAHGLGCQQDSHVGIGYHAPFG
jgi:hypothetical protein